MKGDKNALVLGALAGLMLMSGNLMAESKDKMASDEMVMCHGVNSCKGSGACAGKVDSCSGKNGCSTEITCSGHNTCKGKGLKKVSKKECADLGGKVATK